MQQDHSKAIKGLSIATIVISALAIVFSAIIMAVIGIAMNIADSYTYDITNSYSYYDDYYYDYGYLSPDEYFAVYVGGVFANTLLGFVCICSIFTLVVGIIGLRFHANKDKLGLVFGWSIAGAVIGFLATGIVVAVLLIITAVFANKDKQLYAAGYAPMPQAAPIAPVYVQAPAPVQPIATQPVAAPVAAQPVATPVAAPVATPAGAAPVAAAPVAVDTAAQPVAQPTQAQEAPKQG